MQRVRNSLFQCFKRSKHASTLLCLHAENLLYDVMICLVRFTIFRYHKSQYEDVFKNFTRFTKTVYE